MPKHENVPDDKLSTIYLSGPMTGMLAFNYPAFNAEAAKLRALGHRVFNPAESDLPEASTWQEHMREDLQALLGCNRIHLLPGFGTSKGAMLELVVAQALGMTITLAKP